MNEIGLLKQKLQVKNQVIGNLQGGPHGLKARESYYMRPTMGGQADCGLLCGMGPSTESTSFGRGTVANFMNRETVKK